MLLTRLNEGLQDEARGVRGGVSRGCPGSGCVDARRQSRPRGRPRRRTCPRRGVERHFTPCLGSQRRADGPEHGQRDVGGAAEAHLALGRVHVDVDKPGVNLKVEKEGGVQSRGETAVSVSNGARDDFVFDWPAVEEDVLHSAVAPRLAQGHQVAADAHAGALIRLHGDEALGLLSPDEASDALPKVSGGGEVEAQRAVLHQHEAQLRVGESVQPQLVLNVAGLRLLTFEEFAAHGGVVEEVADADLRTGGTAGAADLRLGAAVAAHFNALDILGSARPEQESRDRSDARQSFPAEAELVNIEEILRATQLAGGVPPQAELRVDSTHAAAVIRHLDERDASAADLHADAASPGINAVLHQLLEHGRGALHHFARRDLAGEHVIHLVNLLFGGLLHRCNGLTLPRVRRCVNLTLSRGGAREHPRLRS